MARIRTIKPDFFRHAGLFDAEQETGLPLRVAFAGLWTVADREGRFRWKPRELKLDCLPHDLVDFAAVLEALRKGAFIVRYERDGEVLGFIPSWHEHQVINTREAKSSIPEPTDSSIHEAHVHAHASTDIAEHVPRGVNVPEPLRQTVFARDNFKCRRCEATTDLTVDHIFPTCIGGTHAINNLRTLCRACNSARPVAGQGLIEDLARDGLTLDDMQRTCMHVHAQGEGKGKEGEEEGKEIAPTTAVVSASAEPAGKPKPSPHRAQAAKEPSPTSATWNAYADAYRSRYGVDPVRNAKVNGQLSQLVARIGGDEAPPVARFFVGLQDPYYVRRMHPVDDLLSNAEKLRTQWATNGRARPNQAAERGAALERALGFTNEDVIDA